MRMRSEATSGSPDLSELASEPTEERGRISLLIRGINFFKIR